MFWAAIVAGCVEIAPCIFGALTEVFAQASDPRAVLFALSLQR
jgi:hypothetical protein